MNFAIKLGAFLPLLAFVALGHAAPVQYDAQGAINQKITENLYVHSVACMREATTAMLRQGYREPEVLRGFNIGACSSALYQHLAGTMKWDKTDVMLLLTKMSDITVYRATN